MSGELLSLFAFRALLWPFDRFYSQGKMHNHASIELEIHRPFIGSFPVPLPKLGWIEFPGFRHRVAVQLPFGVGIATRYTGLRVTNLALRFQSIGGTGVGIELLLWLPFFACAAFPCDSVIA